MDILLDLALEDSGAGRLVKPGGLQDMGGIDPIVLSPSHNMFLEVGAELEFIDGDSTVSGTIDARPGGGGNDSRSRFDHHENSLLSLSSRLSALVSRLEVYIGDEEEEEEGKDRRQEELVSQDKMKLVVIGVGQVSNIAWHQLSRWT